VALAKPIPSLLLLMAIAVAAAVALRLVPQFAPVVGDWAEHDEHGTAISAGGKIRW